MYLAARQMHPDTHLDSLWMETGVSFHSLCKGAKKSQGGPEGSSSFQVEYEDPSNVQSVQNSFYLRVAWCRVEYWQLYILINTQDR